MLWTANVMGSWETYTNDSNLAQRISGQKVLIKIESVHKCKNAENEKYSTTNKK